MSEENILELVSKVDEFLAMHDLFKDDDLDFALSMVIKLIMKPDIPASSAVHLITQLQAISTKLYIVASYNKNVAKPSASDVDYKKKNMYFSIAESINNLVAALKYNIRSS